MFNFFKVISLGCVLCGAFTFVGCIQQEDLFQADDLSIDAQVSITRTSSEQFEPRDPNQFSYGKDECCLVALVELKQYSNFENSFTEDENATMFYNAVKDYATSLRDSNGNQRYYGGAMGHDVFLELGIKYGLLKEKMDFSDSAFKSEAFSNPEKHPKVINIDIEDEETKQMVPHIARVIRIDSERNKVYYSVRKNGRICEQSIRISQVKDAWR